MTEEFSRIINQSNFYKICRTCLKNGQLEPLFDYFDTNDLVEKLRLCTSVQIEKSEWLPENICTECVEKINTCYEFRKTCEESEKVLKHSLKNQTIKEIKTKKMQLYPENCGFSPTQKYESDLSSDCMEIGTESLLKNNNSNICIKDLTEIVKISFKNEDSSDITLKTDDSFIDDLENVEQIEVNHQNGYENGKKKINSEKRCRRCRKNFSSNEELQEHHISEHPHSAIKNETCIICWKKFSKRYIKNHMLGHTLEKPHICEICGYSFSRKQSLSRHLKSHAGIKPHKCDECSKSFSRIEYLRDHLKKHSEICENVYRCSYCRKIFPDELSYRVHVKLHLGSNDQQCNTNTCDTCGEQFENILDLEKHVKNRKECSSLVCSFCGRLFYDVLKYQTHMNRHGLGIDESEHNCKICNKTFKNQCTLKAHRKVHEEKRFLCSICGRHFSSANSLQNHLNLHNGVKPHACKICGKSFTQVATLQTHMLVHSNEKRYLCKICNKGFTVRSHLDNHVRVHTGEKPYLCPFCNRGFAMKVNLTVHIRTHTGETPFVCAVCDKGFYDSSSLKKHRLKVHKIL